MLSFLQAAIYWLFRFTWFGSGGFVVSSPTVSAQVINSVQRGTIALTAVATNTAALTGVVTGKTMTNLTGFTTNVGAGGALTDAFSRLTLSSTILATADKGSASNNATVGYEFIEFK